MNSESDRERDARRSERRQQRSLPPHQQNSKPSSGMMRPINQAGLLLAGGDPSNPYSVAAALAMAANEDNGGFHRQSPFLGGEGSTPPPPDNTALLALYHSPLWQAAIRQQQLQIINHLASLGNPFMSSPGLATSTGPPMNIPPLSPFPPSFGPGSAYSDYIAKYAKAQQTTTTSTSSSPTITSPKLLTPTSGSTNTTSAQAAVAARLAANLMAVAGKTPASSADYTSSISTTSNILSSVADSRAGSQSMRYAMDNMDPLLSSSLLSKSLGMERKDNNNGKHSPPTIPTSIAPIAQSIIGAGRGSGQRSSSGRGRGRGISSHAGTTSDGLNGRDKVRLYSNNRPWNSG